MTFACALSGDGSSQRRIVGAILTAAGIPAPAQTILSMGEATFGADSRRGWGPWEVTEAGVLLLGPSSAVAEQAERYRRTGRCGAGEGAFAAVLWDSRARRLVAERDMFGIVPLYRLDGPDSLLLSDDLPALARVCGSLSADPTWIAEYLSGLDTDPRATPYREIRKLPAGHALQVDLHPTHQAQERPVALPGRSLARPVAPGELPEALREALTRATTTRLGARTACMLSGGLDSGSLAVLAAEHRQPVTALSLVFPDRPEADESAYIAEVLRHGGFEPHLLETVGSCLDDIPALLAEQGQPINGFGQKGIGALYALARSLGMDSILDGHGGDEVVGTGQRHLHRLAQGLKLGALWRQAEGPARLAGRQRGDVVLEVLSNAAPRYRLRRAAAGLRGASGREDAWAWRALVSAELAQSTDLVARARQSAGAPARDDLDAHLDLLRVPATASAFEGHWRTARAHGIEARYPFYDREVVALCLGASEAQRLAGGLTRAPLRQAMEGRLPDKVRLRPDKTDFTAVAWAGLRASSPAATDRLRAAIAGPLSGFVDRETATAAVDRLRGEAPDPTAMRQVWRMGQLAEWLESLPRAAGAAAEREALSA